MLKINDVELEFDLMDADDAEKFEKEIKDLQAKEDTEKVKAKNYTMAESIRKQCNLVFDFFDALFGEGTAKKLFGDKTNYRSCMEALAQVMEYAAKQTTELQKEMAKYSPNRATRRKTK